MDTRHLLLSKFARYAVGKYTTLTEYLARMLMMLQCMVVIEKREDFLMEKENLGILS